MAWVIDVIGLTIDRAIYAIPVMANARQTTSPIARDRVSGVVAADRVSTIESDCAVIAPRILRMSVSMLVNLSSVCPSIMVAIAGSELPTSMTSLAVVS